MKNIHLLATENYKQDYTLQSGEVVKVVRLGQLIINKEYNELSVNKNPQWSASCDTDVLVPHHIYIVCDEKIKDKDYVLSDTSIGALYLDGVINTASMLAENQWKKVILSTDSKLIEDGVQVIDDEFLEWFVKNPSCEWVGVVKEGYKKNGMVDESTSYRYKIIIPQEEMFEMYSHLYGKTVTMNDRFETKHIWSKELALKNKGRWIPQEESKQILCGEPNKFYRCITCDSPCGSEGHYIDKSTISQEQPKQETLEEVAENVYNEFPLRSESLNELAKANFIKGAKWQSERMYSEKDFKLFARQYYREIKLDKSNLLWNDLADKCLEQFKKK